MIYQSIDKYLSSCKRKNIVFCVSNFGPIEMVKNLLISAKQHHLEIVLFALDVEIAEAVNKEFDIDIVLYTVVVEPNKHYKFGSKEFINVAYHRYFIAHKIMLAGKTLIYMDIDIVVCDNFERDIISLLNIKDIVIQYNGVDCCTGFFGMKPTQALIDFFDKKNMLELGYHNYGGDGGLSDQQFFNKFIYRSKYCEVMFLDRHNFPNGAYFYHNVDQFDTEAEAELKIIHFNCIVGYQNKVDTMMKYNRWYL